LYAGGGLGMDHSSVAAPHGLSPAMAPERAERITFTTITSTPSAMM
jgi:hypothetical protein